MSEDILARDEILGKLVNILEIHASIGLFVGKRLCEKCETPEEDWAERRKNISGQMKKLLTKYDFAKSLPRSELGISVLSVLRYIIKIQNSFRQLLVMIDMIRGESFGEVFMDEMDVISSKTGKILNALKNLTAERISDGAGGMEQLDVIVKLEREMDESNIVICRQISVTTENETGYTCYIMRKIVSELEHISDYVKETAEILIDI
ncbi:MAG: DUF47 family protein [Candidatus Thorarchaeota archaeon]